MKVFCLMTCLFLIPMVGLSESPGDENIGREIQNEEAQDRQRYANNPHFRKRALAGRIRGLHRMAEKIGAKSVVGELKSIADDLEVGAQEETTGSAMGPD